MATEKVIAPLSRVPLFMGLQLSQLSEIASHTERISFRAGSKITEAGTVGDGAFLIVAGDAARLPDSGSDTAPEPIEAGSLIGELAMLVDHVYGATVVAQGRVNCLKILRSALYRQMGQDPDLAEYFSTILTERLKLVADQMRRIDQLLAAYTAPASEEDAPAAPFSALLAAQEAAKAPAF